MREWTRTDKFLATIAFGTFISAGAAGTAAWFAWEAQEAARIAKYDAGRSVVALYGATFGGQDRLGDIEKSLTKVETTTTRTGDVVYSLTKDLCRTRQDIAAMGMAIRPSRNWPDFIYCNP